MWENVISFILLLVKSELAIIHFHSIEYSFVFTFTLISCSTAFVVIWIYYLAGVFDEYVIKRLGLDKKFIEFKWIKQIKLFFNKKEKSALNWLLEHNKIIIFIIPMIPFVPFLETIVVVAAKIQKVKGGLYLILLSNTIRIFLVTYFVYNT